MKLFIFIIVKFFEKDILEMSITSFAAPPASGLTTIIENPASTGKDYGMTVSLYSDSAYSNW